VKRNVLEIPLEEIVLHLAKNERQHLKVVAPGILTQELYQRFRNEGKKVKEEVPLEGDRWTHSYKLQPNKLCESVNFGPDENLFAKGPFAISFANDHTNHTEIYFSEHSIGGYYKRQGESAKCPINLNSGGAVVFGPNVVHYVALGGITIIIEIPSVENDKFIKES
jgi:hypothetical protein